MCKNDGESVNYLLLHCSIVRELCSLVLSLFFVSCGLCLILPSKCWEKSVGDTYECHELECLCHQLLCGEFGANGIPIHLKYVNIKALVS